MGLRPRFELYDLKADPSEQNNLAGDPGHGAIQEQLRQKLVAWMKETHDPLLNGPVRSIYNRKICEQLKAAL